MTLLIIAKVLLMLSRSHVGRVDFRYIRLRLILIRPDWNSAAMMTMWNRNSCTLVLFVKILGMG